MSAGGWTTGSCDEAPFTIEGTGKNVGSGTYGSVKAYVAISHGTDRKKTIAVKFPNVDNDGGEGGQRAAKSAIRRYKIERAILESFKEESHINIAQYFGELRCRGSMGLAFEYCRSGTLKAMYTQMKDKRPVNTRDLFLSYARDLLCGLVFLREHHINHRDIKPENIVLDEHHFAKIVDFGFALNFDENEVSRQLDNWNGTPFYLAPEVWSYRTGYSGDVYASGVTLMNMFNNAHRPWAWAADSEVIDYLCIHGNTECRDVLEDTEMRELERSTVKKMIKREKHRRLREEMAKGPKWSDLPITTNFPDVANTIMKMICIDWKARPEAFELLLDPFSPFRYPLQTQTDDPSSGSKRARLGHPERDGDECDKPVLEQLQSSASEVLIPVSGHTLLRKSNESRGRATDDIPESDDPFSGYSSDSQPLDTILNSLSSPSTSKSSKEEKEERSRLLQVILSPSGEEIRKLKRLKYIAYKKAKRDEPPKEDEVAAEILVNMRHGGVVFEPDADAMIPDLDATIITPATVGVTSPSLTPPTLATPAHLHQAPKGKPPRKNREGVRVKTSMKRKCKPTRKCKKLSDALLEEYMYMQGKDDDGLVSPTSSSVSSILLSVSVAQKRCNDLQQQVGSARRPPFATILFGEAKEAEASQPDEGEKPNRPNRRARTKRRN